MKHTEPHLRPAAFATFIGAWSVNGSGQYCSWRALRRVFDALYVCAGLLPAK